MNKLVKILIIINGLMLPILIGVVFYKWIDPFSPKNNIENGIILGERLEGAKIDSIALQGLFYESPVGIYNSTYYYLPISVMTYNEVKDLRKYASSANNLSLSFQHIMNVVFLDNDFEVKSTLLDKKASIIEIEIRERYGYDKKIDITVKNIGYLIGFEDSNRDGKLNSTDNHDLYISDLNGQNLVQATNDIDIVSFEFINSNTEIMIRYKERNDLKEEHKKIKFGMFDIRSSEFKNLSSLNATIQKLENKLLY